MSSRSLAQPGSFGVRWRGGECSTTQPVSRSFAPRPPPPYSPVPCRVSHAQGRWVATLDPFNAFGVARLPCTSAEVPSKKPSRNDEVMGSYMLAYDRLRLFVVGYWYCSAPRRSAASQRRGVLAAKHSSLDLHEWQAAASVIALVLGVRSRARHRQIGEHEPRC